MPNILGKVDPPPSPTTPDKWCPNCKRVWALGGTQARGEIGEKCPDCKKKEKMDLARSFPPPESTKYNT